MTHYRQTGPHHNSRLWYVLVLTIILGVLVAWHITLEHQSPSVSVAPTTAVKPAVASPKVTTRMMFTGDVFWGRSMQTKAEASGKGSKYLTQGLTTADREQYDAWIGNFECPVTNRDVPYALQLKDLKFNCRPEYLPELAQWFSAATLANNHMDNNGGQVGLQQTRQNLEQNGIQYAGTYDMAQTNDICEVLALPARIAHSKVLTRLPVALCGYMYVVDATPSAEALAVMQQYAKVMPVIAMPHMGVEYRATAEAEKVTAYRRMIDNGADVVIGAHPHVIQNSENYKGRLIAYSLGNFLFDQQTLGRSTTLGLAVGVSLTIADKHAADVYASLAAGCVAYKDQCLAQLNEQLGKRPPITVDYKFTCYNQALGYPVKGSDADCAEATTAATVPLLHNLSHKW